MRITSAITRGQDDGIHSASCMDYIRNRGSVACQKERKVGVAMVRIDDIILAIGYPDPAMSGYSGSGRMRTESERYYVEIGSKLYAIDADTASHAIIEVLAGIDDPDTWPGECMVWNHRYYHERYGEPAEVIQL